MLVVMAGLPASGKSRLGRAIAAALHGVVLDKDAIRAALFPPEAIEYSTRQDDFCVAILLQVAGYLFFQDAQRPVILDGRPFSRRYQLEAVQEAATGMPGALVVVECICSDATARARLQSAEGQEHLARNRDFALYQRLKAEFEPLEAPKLVVDTDQPFEQCVAAGVAYIRSAAGVR